MMPMSTRSSPHVRRADGLTRLMLSVIVALIPALAAYVLFFGWGVLVNIALALAAALASEALMLSLRRRPLRPFLTDGSAAVTAVLLGMAIPPLTPWWVIVLGTLFALIFAKHLYGGLGYNPFNPAMVGYVMLLISFPLEMSTWAAAAPSGGQTLSLAESVRYSFTGILPNATTLDAVTAATPLDAVRTQVLLDKPLSEIAGAGALAGSVAGWGWEWINALCLLGGLWLLSRRVITWHIPVGLIAGIATLSGLFYLIDATRYASPLFHLFSGATMLGAFFIATDPVSAATTPAGRIIYGVGIGVLTYVIRTWGGYPDGLAFAVLLMNMAAPTIDYYTKPRVFGQSER